MPELTPATQQTLETIKRHGFWFVDVPRTASTSLKRELETVYGPIYAKKRVTALHDHATALEVKNFLGAEIWDALFTFSAVRNPWSRTYSLFKYRREIAKNIPEKMAFSAYVAALAKEKRRPKDQQTWCDEYLTSACDYLVDKDGKLLVKFVGKMEDRNALFAEINQHLPVPLLGDIHVMRTSREEVPLEAIYDPTTRDIVADLYQDDLNRFGYVFGENTSTIYVPALSPDEYISHLTKRLARTEDDLNILRHDFENMKLNSRHRTDGLQNDLKHYQTVYEEHLKIIDAMQFQNQAHIDHGPFRLRQLARHPRAFLLDFFRMCSAPVKHPRRPL